MTQLQAEVHAAEQRYTPQTLTQEAEVDAALQRVDVLQGELTVWYQASQKTCHERFFVNSCLAEVRAQRNALHVPLQRIRLQAHVWQRATRARKHEAQEPLPE